MQLASFYVETPTLKVADNMLVRLYYLGSGNTPELARVQRCIQGVDENMNGTQYCWITKGDLRTLIKNKYINVINVSYDREKNAMNMKADGGFSVLRDYLSENFSKLKTAVASKDSGVQFKTVYYNFLDPKSCPQGQPLVFDCGVYGKGRFSMLKGKMLMEIDLDIWNRKCSYTVSCKDLQRKQYIDQLCGDDDSLDPNQAMKIIYKYVGQFLKYVNTI